MSEEKPLDLQLLIEMVRYLQVRASANSAGTQGQASAVENLVNTIIPGGTVVLPLGNSATYTTHKVGAAGSGTGRWQLNPGEAAIDAVSIIEAALSTGAASEMNRTASPEVKDAHAMLKALLSPRIKDTAGRVAFEEHAKDPTTWQAPMTKTLITAGVGADPGVLEIAERLLRLAEPVDSDAQQSKVNATAASVEKVDPSTTRDAVSTAREISNEPSGMAVVLCALQVEYRAMRALLAEPVERELAGGALFEEGSLPGSHWRVAVGELGEGNVGAGILAERAMSFFQPQIVLFVGVAGSLKDDLLVGDVVVTTRVDAYTGGKAADDFFARPRTWDAPFRIEQRARAVARASWPPSDLSRIDGAPPAVQFKPIAAGDIVLTSRESPLFAHLRAHYNDAVAIEMEGTGLAQAAHMNDNLPALVIRGISDTTDPEAPGKDAYDRAGWQPRAAAHAASFAVALLRALDPAGIPGHPVGRTEGQRTRLGGADAATTATGGQSATAHATPDIYAGGTGSSGLNGL